MLPAQFISKLRPLVSGPFPDFTIAQAALESAWGASQLAVEANNLFGVKAGPEWTGAVLELPTREWVNGGWTTVQARWRRYADWAACIADHSKILATARYADAARASSGEDYARAVAKAGWATDPTYADKVIAIMRKYLEAPMANSSVNTLIAGSGGTALTAVLAWIFDGAPKPVPAYVTAFAASVIAVLSHAIYNKWIRTADDPPLP